MAKHGQQLSQCPPTQKQPPPAPAAVSAQIQIIEASVTTGPPAPTLSDVMKALQDLGQKLHQVSKNQQALESRLDSLRKRADDIHSNGIRGAEWLNAWEYCLLMNMETDGPSLFMPNGMNEPHWK